MVTPVRRLLPLALAAAAVACGGGGGSGTPDAGGDDLRPADGATDGAAPVDAEVHDAGEGSDVPDAGDAAEADAGSDAAPDGAEDPGDAAGPDGDTAGPADDAGDGDVPGDGEVSGDAAPADGGGDGAVDGGGDADGGGDGDGDGLCGNGVLDPGEECDDGEANSDTEPNACRTDCTEPSCGDGVVDEGESCDDGDADPTDACKPDCTEGPGLPKPTEGEVVVTELMIDPDAVDDADGEWIELESTVEGERSLVGCVLRDDGDDEVVLGAGGSAEPVIGPGERLVLGASANPGLNGGVSVDVAYDGLTLGKASDEVVLECPSGEDEGALGPPDEEAGDGSSGAWPGVEIDRVAWTATGYPIRTGRALALDGESIDAGANDAPEAWCPASQSYGDGDLGTPGEANPACPEPDHPPDLCRLAAPEPPETGAIERYVGESLSMEVELREMGLTDRSPGIDALEALRVEVGFGPDGSEPGDEAWSWSSASPQEGWTSEGDLDGYAGTVALEAEGTLDAAARVSLDGGESWTACDRGAGSDDGYQPAESLPLEVVPDPCAGASCDDPPPVSCADDGVTVEEPKPDAGFCEAEDGSVTCRYPTEETDCGLDGSACADGACGAAAAAPDGPGALVFTEIMVRPEGSLTMELGQWVELYNPGDEPVDLAGCALRNAAGDELPLDALVVGVDGRRVLGAATSKPLNGGLEPDRAWGDAFSLAETGAVSLVCDGETIDEVDWDDGWPVEPGASLSLSPFDRTAEANDEPEPWCPGSEVYGLVDAGTPGAANANCPGDVEAIDACRMPDPASVERPAGTPMEVRLRLVEAGITDATTGTDTAEALRVELGLGPEGSTPSTATWSWEEAEPDGGWDAADAEAEADVDQWLAGRAAPAPGTRDVLFRVSADGGNTWTLCDRSEVDGSYEAGEGVRLTTTASPCHPSPCAPDPGRGCDGPTVVEREAPVTCRIDEGAASCAWSTTPVHDCTEVQGSCQDGACTDLPPAPASGEIVLTELMAAPEGGPSAEWVELVNLADGARDLAGCRLESGAAESWTIPSDAELPLEEAEPPFLVEAGARRVFVRSSEAEVGTDVGEAAIYGDAFGLDAEADSLALRCGDTLVDQVSWDVGAGWASPVGTSLSLSGNRTDAVSNDVATAWCAGPTPSEDGESAPAGTPLSANPVCPPPDATLDACRLVTPASSVERAVGASLEVAGTLTDEGTTDATTGVDVAPGVRAQAGHGPDGTMPGEGGWSWRELAPDESWEDPEADRWVGEITPTAAHVGDRDVAVRFSLDGGTTWTVCDADGDDGSYDPAEAGSLQVVEGPCVPNPCSAPPAPSCTGPILEYYAPTGTCAPEGDDAACTYESYEKSCVTMGTCSGGACTDPPPSPEAKGDLVITEVMVDSSLPPPDRGEWIEVHNPGSTDRDLRGCELTDADGEATELALPAPAVVPAGGYAVLGVDLDPDDNGGLTPTIVWNEAEFGLDNLFDEIELRCNDVLIDDVAYDPSWPRSTGRAMQLGSGSLDADANDDPVAWCPASETYGSLGDRGTPGASNEPCP